MKALRAAPVAGSSGTAGDAARIDRQPMTSAMQENVVVLIDAPFCISRMSFVRRSDFTGSRGERHHNRSVVRSNNGTARLAALSRLPRWHNRKLSEFLPPKGANRCHKWD